MQNREQLVADIIALAPEQKLVSRVRLQKIAYLLEQMGCDLGFEYSYHHYGPFSHDLDRAILDAKAFGLVKEVVANRKSDGASYSIFELTDGNGSSESSTIRSFKNHIQRFAKSNITVLELASTANWLTEYEKVDDWQKEIIKRKGVKTRNNRLENALDLLRELHLPPAANPQ